MSASAANGEGAEPDPELRADRVWSEREALAMIRAGEIRDAKTLAGLLHVLGRRPDQDGLEDAHLADAPGNHLRGHARRQPPRCHQKSGMPVHGVLRADSEALDVPAADQGLAGRWLGEAAEGAQAEDSEGEGRTR